MINIPGIPNFLVVAPNIFRGGQPTDDGWAFLRKAGVTRVIKLNLESEGSEDGARKLGMEIIYKPIDLDEQLLFRPKYDDVSVAAHAMVPRTFIHCTHGEDRTGLVVACYRVWVEGWEKKVAEAEMKQHGFHPELLGLELFWEWAI